MKKLNEQERKFCVEYVKNNNNAFQAALAAGYSEENAFKNSFRFLKRPHIKEYVDNLLEKIDKKVGVSLEWKINKLRLAVERSLPDEEEKAKINPQIGITAIAELNKMQGHHSAEKLVTTNLNVDTDIDNVKSLMDELIDKHNKNY